MAVVDNGLHDCNGSGEDIFRSFGRAGVKVGGQWFLAPKRFKVTLEAKPCICFVE